MTLTYEADAPLYTTEQVALAANVTVSALNGQWRHGFPKLEKPGTGRARLFSFRRVLQIVIMQRLSSRFGIPFKYGCELAELFTDAGPVLANDKPAVLRIIFPVDTADADYKFRARILRRESDISSQFRELSLTDDTIFIDLRAIVVQTRERLGLIHPK